MTTAKSTAAKATETKAEDAVKDENVAEGSTPAEGVTQVPASDTVPDTLTEDQTITKPGVNEETGTFLPGSGLGDLVNVGTLGKVEQPGKGGFVADQTTANAVKLLAAAEAVGVDPTEVITVDGGFQAPDAVIDEYNRLADAEDQKES